MMDLVASVLGSPRVGLDVDQIADAIWLAQFLPTGERAAVTSELAAAPDQPGPAARTDAPIDRERPPRTEPRPGPAEPELAPGQVDIARAPLAGELAPDAVRFRSPAAPALSRQLEVARAIRPLGWRSPRPGAWHLLEELTADRIARTGLWLAELAPDTEPALDLVVVVDTSPRLRVWRRVTHELIDVLRSSGSFRMTTTWTLTGDQPDLVIRSVGGEIYRAPQHLAGPGHRTAMLVISDFAGPLWKSDAGLACVRLWSQRTMMALVSLVPQRSWGRTSLGALPATRLSSIRRGCPSASLRSEAAVVAGAIPIPVVSLDPASLGTWARLVAGHAQVRSRGVLALSDTSPAAQARYAAAAMQAECGSDIEDMLSALRLVALQTRATAASLDARERVERFCETHRPEVVELAAALISAPLELSVMLVVQRAIAPRTGTLELAEIIDSGLLEIEPQQPGDGEVRFRIADDLRDHLSPLASIGGHLRVLEVVGAYLRDHLGSSIDFEALVVDPSRPVGPIADKDRRFARMFVAELRRLGIDTNALAHLQAPDPVLSAAAEPMRSPAIAEFSERWVAVAGTAVAELASSVQLAAEALGRELAHRGFGLHTRTRFGVDLMVARAFEATLRLAGIDPTHRVTYVDRRSLLEVDEIVRSVFAVVLIGGRLGTRRLRDRMRAAEIPVVAFRGSGGVADEEMTLKQLELRAELHDASDANDEAGHVVDQLCAIAVAPARAKAFTQLRDRLSADLPAFAQRLRLGVDGRVTIALPERGVASVATAISRTARGTGPHALSLAFELLAQLRAWTQVAELAAWCAAGDAVTAAEPAACTIAAAKDQFQLWSHIAQATGSPIAVRNALDAASAAGDPSLVPEALQLEALDPSLVRGFLTESLDDLADHYDRVREDDPGPERATKLDLVVEQAVQAAASAPAEDAIALWRRGTPGARAVALAVCWSNPAAAPIEIIVDSLEQLRSEHEPWIALQALRQVAVARHPLDTDPAIAALVRRLRLGEGFEDNLTVLATQTLAAYLERCALSPALVARLDVVEEWLRAGEQTVAGACMAFIGGAPASPWTYGDLAEALGGELALRGWEVIAAPGREVGARATLGAKRADGIVQLAADGGEALMDRADCVIAMAGQTGTEREWKLARARKLPVVALAFTGGAAERVWPLAQRDLLARGIPGELLSPLHAVSVSGDAARLIARVAGVVVARTHAARPDERPPLRAALRKVSGLVSRAFAAYELAMLAQDVDLDLSPQLSLSHSVFHVADDLVTLCAAQGVLDRLVFAMLRRRPEWMLEITRALDMYPWTGNTAVDHYLTRYRDPASWGHECLDAGSCVCEVRVDGRAVGTGFLVGPDAVLTSYHAIGERVLRAPDARARLAFVFDRIPMLNTSSAGVIVPPADTSWTLAASPPAPGELSDSKRGDPSDDQLDFALIRLSRAVGVEPRHHRARSWLRAEPRSARFHSVAIPHYSRYRGLTLALSDSGEYELSRSATRVRYTIDVQRGSSGAPVFDAATWKLVALHQRTTRNGRRQGIPIARIAQHPAVQRYLACHSE